MESLGVLVADQSESEVERSCSICGQPSTGDTCDGCWGFKARLPQLVKTEAGQALVRQALGSTGLVQVEQSEGERLIAMVRNPDGSINTAALAVMMELRDKLMAEQAKAKYLEAFANFQRECPPIPMTKQGAKAKYAPMADVERIVRPTATKYGFSWSHREVNTEPCEVCAGKGFILRDDDAGKAEKATCPVCRGAGKVRLADGKVIMWFDLSHVGGHTHSTPWGPYDPNALGSLNLGKMEMNALQAQAGATSYAKRYSACLGLGITPEGEDTDGRLERAGALDVERVGPEQIAGLKKIATESQIKQILTYFKVSELSELTLKSYGQATQMALAGRKKQQQAQSPDEPPASEPVDRPAEDAPPLDPQPKTGFVVWACGGKLQGDIQKLMTELEQEGVQETHIVDLAVDAIGHARYPEMTVPEATKLKARLERRLSLLTNVKTKGGKK